MRSLLCVVLALSVASASASLYGFRNVAYKSPLEHFQDFTVRFGRVYESEAEWDFRFQTFQANLKKIEDLNRKEKEAGGSAYFGINEFADYHDEEFRGMYLGYRAGPQLLKAQAAEFAAEPDFDLPTSYDWRDHSAVTPVKDQGQCGSCWAFSATETIESSFFLAGNTLTEFAPEQIVACDQGHGDYGCGGGWPYKAYEYVERAGGIVGESDFPYTSGTTGQDGPCTFDESKVVAKVTGYTYATKTNDEDQMAQALVKEGPLSVCVDASSWSSYQGGILTSCGQSIDHCVQAVGFNTDATTGQEYWIVRNSWNTSWGMQGYIYVAKGSNTCAIAEQATNVQTDAA